MADGSKAASTFDRLDLSPKYGLMVPRVQPGEWINGALGRFRVLNGTDGGRSEIRALQKEVRRRGMHCPASPIDFLVQVHGQSHAQIYAENSCLPFINLFRAGYAVSKLHSRLLSGDRFCAECAAQAGRERGYSLWSPQLQIPGVTRCADCGGPLTVSKVPATQLLPHLIAPDDCEPLAQRWKAKGLAADYERVALFLLKSETSPQCNIQYRLCHAMRSQGCAPDQFTGNSALPEKYVRHLSLVGVDSPYMVGRALTSNGLNPHILIALALAVTKSTDDAVEMLRP